jgi:hypothetical protein
MAALYRNGATLQQIGDRYGVTREACPTNSRPEWAGAGAIASLVNLLQHR